MLVTRRVPIARIEANIFSSMKSNGILQSHGGWLSRDSDLICNCLKKGSVATDRPLIVVYIQYLGGYKESCSSPDETTLKKKKTVTQTSNVVAFIEAEQAADISSDHFVSLGFISKHDGTPSNRLTPFV